jgi:uncharacterized protein (DUF2147 family)
LFFARKIGLSLVLSTVLATCAFAQAPDATGTYMNETGRTKVKLDGCKTGLCGTVIWMQSPVNDINNPDVSKRNRPVVGIQAVSLKSTGPDTYAGTLYDTESGKTYTGKAKFSGTNVELSGCILGGLICRTSTWQRVE